jgi:hypothetical protein
MRIEQSSHFFCGVKVRSFCLGLFMILLVGCACPTDLDDDGKVVKPTVYCNVNFISAAPDNRNLTVKTEFRTILDALDYNNTKDFKYLETEAKKTTLKLFEQETMLYQNMMSLEEKHYYSCFVHGINSWIKVLILEDMFEDMNKSMSHYRVMNLSADSPKLLIRISGDTQRNFVLSYGEHSEIAETRPRKYDIDIFDAAKDSLILSLEQIEVKSGYFYNFVIRGYTSIFHHIRLECIVIESRII